LELAQVWLLVKLLYDPHGAIVPFASRPTSISTVAHHHQQHSLNIIPSTVPTTPASLSQRNAVAATGVSTPSQQVHSTRHQHQQHGESKRDPLLMSPSGFMSPPPTTSDARSMPTSRQSGGGHHRHPSFSFTKSTASAPTPSTGGGASASSTSVRRRRGSFGDWTDQEIMEDCLAGYLLTSHLSFILFYHLFIIASPMCHRCPWLTCCWRN
jgi:hypothetical protein